MISQIYKDPSPKVLKMFEAVSQLLEEGADPRELKVSDITNRAGIGKGTAYEYFKSKEELIGEAQLFYFTERFTMMQTLVKSTNSFEEAIEVMCKGIDGVLDNRTGLEVLFKHAASNMDERGKGACQNGGGMKEFFQQLGKRGQEEGVIKETDMDIIQNVLVTELVGYGMSCSMWVKNPGGEETIEEQRKRYLAYCKKAISLLLNS